MAVLMFQKQFVLPILSGRKRQTIRPPRKRRIKVGELLSLRHWYDKAYRSPQVEITTVKCSGVFGIQIERRGIQVGLGSFRLDHKSLDEFARGDGFSCWLEMRDFFQSRFGYGLPFQGVLYQWEWNDGHQT